MSSRNVPTENAFDGNKCDSMHVQEIGHSIPTASDGEIFSRQNFVDVEGVRRLFSLSSVMWYAYTFFLSVCGHRTCAMFYGFLRARSHFQ